MKIKSILSSLFILISLSASANGIRESVQETGLFWVAVAVLVLVLLGIFAYLFRLEKKLKNLEDEK